MTLNWIDIIAAIVVVLIAVQGLRRGFIREISALLAILAAFLLASLWYKLFSASIIGIFRFPKETVYIISFFIIWLIMYSAFELVGSVLSRIIKGLISIPPLEPTGGAILGLLRGMVIVWIVLLLALALPFSPKTVKNLKGSKTVSFLLPILDKTYTKFLKMVPKDIPHVKDFFEKGKEIPSKIRSEI